MILNKWQVQEVKGWNGPLFDPKKTLRAINRSSPEKIRKTMVKLHAYNSGRTLEAQLEEIGTKYVDSIDDFYYEIIADSRRNVQLIEARYQGNVVTAADMEVGKGGGVIELLFGEDYFFFGEVIVGEKNERYPLRIIKEPQPEGTNVRYFVEAWGLPQGIPGTELTAGKKFSPEYAPVEAGLSRAVGGVRRGGYSRVKGLLSTIRIDHKVAGDIDSHGVLMGFPVLKNGKEEVMNVLSTYEDYLVDEEFSKYKNHALAYGTTNVDELGQTYSKGKSGRDIIMGPGLMQQYEQSNTVYFNFFSLELLESVLQQLSYNKLSISKRQFVIQTGQAGAAEFHKAVLNTTSGWQAFLTSGNGLAISKTTSELHTNSLKAGFQFTEYLSANGISVKIDINEMYDDPVRNKIMMPGTMIPAMSYRMDIVYKGTVEEPNVQKLMYRGLEGKGGEYRGYSSGFRNPFTKNNNVDFMGTDEDSATITKFTHLGVVVYNPELCASLIPSILQ